MAKKQMSFAEKAARHKGHREWKTIKYIKSERSEKTGNWRFNESFVRLGPNENIDQALARMEKEIEEMAKEMASMRESNEKVSTKEETAKEETKETKVEEDSVEQTEAKQEKPKDTKEAKVEVKEPANTKDDKAEKTEPKDSTEVKTEDKETDKPKSKEPEKTEVSAKEKVAEPTDNKK